ncbi:hypothetical protein [Nocardia stercoris]|uniref:Uncharacterized protein n=1 Tax=Nocardia stercoris TaxID=2483361 RepID=A0A3M2KS62_9NOCA|nr:hypothetical protein [Nocardia stercoris]RMI27911.1 hypothetical protein EBN03_32230 [Nocardia stercoris]
MAIESVTISIDSGELGILREAAARADMALAPYIIRSARAWAMLSDADRHARRPGQAAHDRREAEALLHEHRAAEAEARRRGHAA